MTSIKLVGCILVIAMYKFFLNTNLMYNIGLSVCYVEDCSHEKPKKKNNTIHI